MYIGIDGGGTKTKMVSYDDDGNICQEIVLGMAGIELLRTLGLNPTVYHMNEGHSAFLTLKLIENIIKEDETELPAGYPRLWFCVYNNELHIMNLRRKILKK